MNMDPPGIPQLVIFAGQPPVMNSLIWRLQMTRVKRPINDSVPRTVTGACPLLWNPFEPTSVQGCPVYRCLHCSVASISGEVTASETLQVAMELVLQAKKDFRVSLLRRVGSQWLLSFYKPLDSSAHRLSPPRLGSVAIFIEADQSAHDFARVVDPVSHTCNSSAEALLERS